MAESRKYRYGDVTVPQVTQVSSIDDILNMFPLLEQGQSLFALPGSAPFTETAVTRDTSGTEAALRRLSSERAQAWQDSVERARHGLRQQEMQTLFNLLGPTAFKIFSGANVNTRLEEQLRMYSEALQRANEIEQQAGLALPDILAGTDLDIAKLRDENTFQNALQKQGVAARNADRVAQHQAGLAGAANAISGQMERRREHLETLEERTQREIIQNQGRAQEIQARFRETKLRALSDAFTSPVAAKIYHRAGYIDDSDLAEIEQYHAQQQAASQPDVLQMVEDSAVRFDTTFKVFEDSGGWFGGRDASMLPQMDAARTTLASQLGETAKTIKKRIQEYEKEGRPVPEAWISAVSELENDAALLKHKTSQVVDTETARRVHQYVEKYLPQAQPSPVPGSTQQMQSQGVPEAAATDTTATGGFNPQLNADNTYSMDVVAEAVSVLDQIETSNTSAPQASPDVSSTATDSTASQASDSTAVATAPTTNASSDKSMNWKQPFASRLGLDPDDLNVNETQARLLMGRMDAGGNVAMAQMTSDEFTELARGSGIFEDMLRTRLGGEGLPVLVIGDGDDRKTLVGWDEIKKERTRVNRESVGKSLDKVKSFASRRDDPSVMGSVNPIRTGVQPGDEVSVKQVGTRAYLVVTRRGEVVMRQPMSLEEANERKKQMDESIRLAGGV